MGELGSRLIRAREARGLSLGDAERDTRISRRYLEALEAEQFDLIPAPVYARGFLRSYSQYLGEDPQEMMTLFPREEDDEIIPASGSPAHASPQSPVSATSLSRPVWKRPPRPQAPRMPQSRQNTVEPPPAAVPVTPPDEPTINFVTSDGPTIGVDIGYATPARRINPNLAGKSRNLLVAGIAIAAVLGVVLLAMLISNLGGDSKAPTSPTPTTRNGTAATATPVGTVAGGGSVTPGAATPAIVPGVRGATVTEAHAKLEAAGYVVTELHQKDTQPKNTVIDQSPAADTELERGLKVTIVVSDGP